MTVPRDITAESGSKHEVIFNEPTVPRDETDAAFETVRDYIESFCGSYTITEDDALAALTTIQDEMKRLREQAVASRGAARATGMKLGETESQLTETRDQLEKAKAQLEGVTHREAIGAVQPSAGVGDAHTQDAEVR